MLDTEKSLLQDDLVNTSQHLVESKQLQSETSSSLNEALIYKNRAFWDSDDFASRINYDLVVAENAYQLNPSDKEIQSTLFKIYCIQMNFRKALMIVRQNKNIEQQGLVQYFHKFSHFNYSSETRPSDEVFLTFLENCTANTNLVKWSTKRREIMGAIYLYQMNKVSPEYQVNCALALIRNMNNPYGATVKYSAVDRSLQVTSRKHFLAHGKFSMHKAMQQLPLDTVILDIDGIMAIENLKGTSVRTLDISKVDELHMMQRTHLPYLEFLKMSKGQFQEGYVREQLISNHTFIIEYH